MNDTETWRHRGPVAPVPTGAMRPIWSIMVPTYNAGGFLEQTLRSVLAQDSGSQRMQIMVVDDASHRDDPQAIVRKVAPGRISFIRQPHNVGHIANFQTCLEQATGEFVHLLHGDDWVEPGFYAAMEAGFAAGAGAAFSASRYVNEEGAEIDRTSPLLARAGLLVDPVLTLAQEQRVMTPSIAVRRSVYEELGGFDRRLACCEDWEMWVRIASRHSIWHDPRYLASYRMHPSSSSARHVVSGEDIAYTRKAISIMSTYSNADVSTDARRLYAQTALGMARRQLALHRPGAARAQAREAFLLDPRLSTLSSAARIALRSCFVTQGS